MTYRVQFCAGNTFYQQSLLDILSKRFPEIETCIATNTNDCLNLAMEFQPHIFFINFFYQKNNASLKLVQNIRESCPSTIIIVFTEYHLDEYRVAGILAGGNHVIPKDLWTGREILALVETIFKNNGFTPEKEIQMKSHYKPL